MARIRRFSIAVPITFGAVAVPVTAALLAGWSVLLGRRIAQAPVASDIWLLVLGAVAFAAVITILVLFAILLAREIREVRRQDSFIDSVTHELKSPLAALKLCLETLGRPDLPAPQHLRLRQMMLDDVERLTGFIDRVLAATRLPAERSSQPLQLVALAVLARRCVAVVTRRAHQAEEVVKIDVPAELMLTTDEVALAAVLENLLDNAVKYSQQVVDVELSARPGRKGQVVIEVRDRGIGIERADLRRVFERFYRAPNEDVRSRRGTGLGLFVVSTLVRSLGGKVTAESAGAGQGTTMRVVLPSRPRTRALRLG